MKKRKLYICLLALSTVLLFSGCRSKVKETETETQSETQTVRQTETEKETQKATQKETQKATEKKTSSTEKKTTVKPSTTKPSAAPQTEAQSGQTSMCPYCYHYFSTVPDNSDGSSIYSRHVAQEKSWADTYGYGSTPATNQPATEAPSTDAPATDASSGADDSAQCPYCYQWFTVSDGSYAAHISAENASLGLPEGSDYVTCPKCGNTYKRGIEYDTHYCTGEQ